MYNVHLLPGRGRQKARADEITALLQWLTENKKEEEKEEKSGATVEIVVGDFNLAPCEKGYTMMEEAGFESAVKRTQGK